MTDKQFKDAFKTAGGWFILTQYETIATWTGDRADLVDYIYLQGFDKNRVGSSSRVSSVLRIIENGRGREAIMKIRDSKTINRQHIQAHKMASELLDKIH